MDRCSCRSRCAVFTAMSGGGDGCLSLKRKQHIQRPGEQSSGLLSFMTAVGQGEVLELLS